jgi:putative two-component system response regulator
VQEPTLKTARILIVDDDESNIRLLGRILASAGYTGFKTLTDPRQVVALYQKWTPDLILLDLLMPHVDGFAVMKQLQSLVPP